MQVIIVGAGIAGLSLAIALARSKHRVVVLDANPELAELGAGVQLTPQAVRYLFQWGMEDDIAVSSIVPEKMTVKDFAAGEVLAEIPTGEMRERYGAPYIVVHRAVLHSMLHKHAVEAGATLRLNTRVVKYDFENGAVELHDGSRLTADLVVGADGINSLSRKQLLGAADPGSQPTGWAAIRMMVEVADIHADPAIADIANTETRSSHFWIAPGKSCMSYQIKDGTLLNIVLSHPDDIDMSKFTLDEYRAFVKETFQDFEPRVQKLLQLALPKIQNFPVYQVPPIPRWVHPSGRFTLVGDSAHAMAFYLSMGVSLAVEDAVSLATALELACPAKTAAEEVFDADKLRTALLAFEQARMKRVEVMQAASLHAGNMAHVEEGEKRRQLYAALRTDGMDGTGIEDTALLTQGITYGLGDCRVRDWCYGHDTVKVMRECYKAMTA